MSEYRIPEKLNTDNTSAIEWKRWIQAFEIYECAAELEEKKDKVKVAIFLNIIGPDGVEIFNSFKEETFERTENEKKITIKGKEDLEWIKNKFESYFTPKKNTTYERYVFFKRDQTEGESIELYYSELKNLAKTCEFQDLKDSLIKDRLIIGMTDENIRQRFLQEAAQYELTAEKIVETVKIKETSILQVKAINHDAKESIDYIKDKTRKYKKFENKKKTHNIETKNNKKCGRCNLEHPPKQCRAYNQKCMKCKKIGHWAICCKNNCRETNEIIKEHIKFLGEIKESINQK